MATPNTARNTASRARTGFKHTVKTGREPTEPRPLPRDRTPHLTPHTCPPCVCCIRGHRRGRSANVSRHSRVTPHVWTCAGGRPVARPRPADTGPRTPSGHTTTVATEHFVPKRRRQGRDLYLSSYPDFKLSEFDARHSDSRETVLGRESPARVYNACSVAYRRLTFSIAHPSTVPEAQPQARGRARLQSLIRNHRIRITDEGGAASGAPTREPRRAARPPA